MRTACPTCGSESLDGLLELAGVPAHSCLLLPTRSRADRVPAADIRLVRCTRCDLAFNAAFDAGAMRYAPDYDGSQAASPTFNHFQLDLARFLTRHCDLGPGSTVLDVGAGRGEFLAALRSVAPMAAIAIDPATPDPATPDAEGIAVHRALLEDAPPTPPADLVCCRHTLEHIAEPVRFLTRLRERVRPGGWVFIEVPAGERIWTEGAFWDIYHEHATTFTAPALEHALLAAGLSPGWVAPAYDAQYLLALARVGVPPRWPVTEPVTPADTAQRLADSS